MFTGIIQTIGKVIKYDGKRLWITAPIKHPKLGESISIDGVCLTLAARKKAGLAFDLGKETERLTTLSSLKSGDSINMERALRVGDRLGGHWVSGHVEQKGRILKIERARQNYRFTVQIPANIKRYVVEKGSIAMDGISLTVADVRGSKIKIMIIPHTLKHTTLSNKRVGDRVNIETDLLAKYVIR